MSRKNSCLKGIYGFLKTSILQKRKCFSRLLTLKKTEKSEAKTPEKRSLILKIKAAYSTGLAIFNYHQKNNKQKNNKNTLEKVHSEFRLGNNRDLFFSNPVRETPLIQEAVISTVIKKDCVILSNNNNKKTHYLAIVLNLRKGIGSWWWDTGK